ncbi:hypothetical protein C8R44DRAFT_752155 [Mycena epipterygia]|nr:hypothetical protein C8R44DRAFT_752155 [Mycena epipterygia]
MDRSPYSTGIHCSSFHFQTTKSISSRDMLSFVLQNKSVEESETLGLAYPIIKSIYRPLPILTVKRPAIWSTVEHSKLPMEYYTQGGRQLYWGVTLFRAQEKNCLIEPPALGVQPLKHFYIQEPIYKQYGRDNCGSGALALESSKLSAPFAANIISAVPWVADLSFSGLHKDFSCKRARTKVIYTDATVEKASTNVCAMGRNFAHVKPKILAPVMNVLPKCINLLGSRPDDRDSNTPLELVSGSNAAQDLQARRLPPRVLRLSLKKPTFSLARAVISSLSKGGGKGNVSIPEFPAPYILQFGLRS